MLPNVSLPPPVDRVSDGDLLLRALRDRDEQAFVEALDAYYPAMLRLARSHVRDDATAEEVVQETWLAALAGVDRFEGRASVKTWLFRILRNIARGRGRRDARQQPFSVIEGAAADAGSGGTAGSGGLAEAVDGRSALWTTSTDPEEELLSRELAEHIDAAIARLPPRQREVIVLRDVEGWNPDDVCNALGLSDTNQRVMLHRARNRVRHELRKYLADSDPCGDADGVELR